MNLGLSQGEFYAFIAYLLMRLFLWISLGEAPNRPEGTLCLVLTHQAPIRYLPHMKTLFQTSISGRVPALPERRFLINRCLPDSLEGFTLLSDINKHAGMEKRTC